MRLFFFLVWRPQIAQHLGENPGDGVASKIRQPVHKEKYSQFNPDAQLVHWSLHW
jgi:hypothetical protein